MTKSTSISMVHYPNEIGRVHVSLKSMSIVPLETKETYIGDVMAREGKKKSKKSKIDENAAVAQNVDRDAIDAIWKHLGLGHIDISYACVGYSMDGRPILNHDEFVNLLINYGFKVQDILPFIDDFSEHSSDDKKSPIIMYTANTTAIMTNIEPIV